jgi:hypothetical protein
MSFFIPHYRLLVTRQSALWGKVHLELCSRLVDVKVLFILLYISKSSVMFCKYSLFSNFIQMHLLFRPDVWKLVRE